jgi:DNA-directed RNA polymerase subunit N (RpoN/RPB10)
VVPVRQFECGKMIGKYLKSPVICFSSLSSSSFLYSKIELVKPIAKQIEDEYEYDDEEEIGISAVIIRITYS